MNIIDTKKITLESKFEIKSPINIIVPNNTPRESYLRNIHEVNGIPREYMNGIPREYIPGESHSQSEYIPSESHSQSEYILSKKLNINNLRN